MNLHEYFFPFVLIPSATIKFLVPCRKALLPISTAGRCMIRPQKITHNTTSSNYKNNPDAVVSYNTQQKKKQTCLLATPGCKKWQANWQHHAAEILTNHIHLHPKHHRSQCRRHIATLPEYSSDRHTGTCRCSPSTLAPLRNNIHMSIFFTTVSVCDNDNPCSKMPSISIT